MSTGFACRLVPSPMSFNLMNIRSAIRWISSVGLCAVAACGGEPVAPPNGPAAALTPASTLSQTGPVGAALPTAIVVKVTDASGRPVPNAAVALAVTKGNGSIAPRVALTDALGQAIARWTLGTVLGPNEVTASVTGVAAQVRFEAAGTAGAVDTIAIAPRNVRLLVTDDSLRITARSLDAFGNPALPAPSFLARDPSIITIDSTGLVRAVSRGSATYVVVAAGSKIDSVLVTVLASGQSVCTGAAAPVDLAVGQVVTNAPGAGFCVHASSASTEYAVIPYFDSPGVPAATVPLQIRGQGLTAPPVPSLAIFHAAPSITAPPGLVPDYRFEAALRDRERANIASRAASARAWYSATRNIRAASATATVVPAVGDMVRLNVNAVDFCDSADYRDARVVAVTNKAIVVADVANPAGGFTDDEYRSMGVTFDTLVDPVDRAAFGDVTDIDNNGHVILFFTRAVNELTPAGASSIVLGFFYSRDLLPKTAAPGPCSGSNVGEMFYLMVPDTGGVVNSNKRSKAPVVSFSNGTVAHEYQHLINASRRLYVNGAGNVTEEKWLDEGLAHVAEELNFFRAAGLTPRGNLDSTAFADPKFAAAYSTFEENNFKRYGTYLQQTETQSPLGVDPFDDDLPTRGAAWDFLRYAADHLSVGQENAFWFKLVNSKTSGIANLTNALGAPPNSMLRDWAVSVFLDDKAPNVDPRFLQPSWNLRSALIAGGVSTIFPLVGRTLSDNVTSSFTLLGNGVSFLRFSVPNGQDALLTVTSNGQPLPPTVLLSFVRVR
jgi:hypothetical protein